MLRVLLTDDSSSDRGLLVKQFARLDEETEISEASSLKSAIIQIGRTEFDLIIMDLNLPDSRGEDTFYEIQACAGTIPIVVRSGNEDEDLAMRLLDAGCADYLLKGELRDSSLVRILRQSIRRQSKRYRPSKAEQSDLREVRTHSKRLKETMSGGSGEHLAAGQVAAAQSTIAQMDLQVKTYSKLNELTGAVERTNVMVERHDRILVLGNGRPGLVGQVAANQATIAQMDLRGRKRSDPPPPTSRFGGTSKALIGIITALITLVATMAAALMKG